MRFRCPSCNKFCSVELSDSDLQAETSGGDSTAVQVHITGNVTLVSECCGEDVGEIEIDAETEITVREQDITEF